MKTINQNDYLGDSIDNIHKELINTFVSEFNEITDEAAHIIFSRRALEILRSVEDNSGTKPLDGIPYSVDPEALGTTIFILDANKELIEEFEFVNVSFG